MCPPAGQEHNICFIMIIHNFDKTETKSLTITDDMIAKATLAADLVGVEKEKVTFNGGKLSLPPHSSVVIRSAE